jgi:cobalamin biosynthesis protein CobD/CbiB
LIGIAIEQLLAFMGYMAWIDVFLLALILSPIACIFTCLGVSNDKKIENSYRNLARATNQNLIMSDDHGARRACAVCLSISMVEWLIAPIIFYLIGGVPFVYLYVALSMFIRISASGRAPFTSLFGFFHSVLKGIAGFISGLFITLAAIFTAGGRPLKFFKSLGVGDNKALAAFAYTQNLTLGGSYQNRHGEGIKAKWIGPSNATAKITHKDIIRLCMQYAIALFLFCVLMFAGYAFT